MSVAFPFDRNFQIGILSLMSTRLDFLTLAVELISPASFEDKILQWFYATMKEYYATYNGCASNQVLANEMMKAARSRIIKDTEFAEYGAVLKKLLVPVQSQQYMMDEVVRFCRRQAGRKVFLETAPTMDSAGEVEWDGILDRMFQVRNIGINYLDKGHWYFKDAANRCLLRDQMYNGRLSSTGITGIDPMTGHSQDLDELIGGGLQEGQLGIWLGGTGGGKSISLCHIGKYAAVRGQRVMHYTVELSTQQVAARYDSAWCDIDVRQLRGNSPQVVQTIDQLANTGYADRLLITFYPSGSATVNTIRNHLRQLEGMGWAPDVIIVDYLDLLKPTTSYEKRYDDLGVITTDLRGLAGELRLPIWTATQVNRPGLNQDIVDIEHIGDSLQKAQIADIIIAMCANRQEKLDHTMRLFLAKNRNGPDKIQIEIETNFSRMKLYEGSAKYANPSAAKGQP